MKCSLVPLFVAILFLAFSQDVFACATCFGNEDDTQTHGLNGAIITMLGVTYTLFISAAVTAVIFWKRNQRKIAAAAAEDAEILNSLEELPHG